MPPKSNNTTVKADRIDSTASNGRSIEIRDDEKHLLFCYDPVTDCIEIKSRGKLYSINIFALRSQLKRNVIAEHPVRDITVHGVKEGNLEVLKDTENPIGNTELDDLQSDRSVDA